MADTTSPDQSPKPAEAQNPAEERHKPKTAAELAQEIRARKEAAHGQARVESQDIQTEAVKKRLDEIAKKQKELEEEQKKTSGSRPAEDWTSKEDKNTENKVEDIKAEVVSTLNEPEQLQMLGKMGLTDEKYKSALTGAFTGILNDKFHKMDVGLSDLADSGTRVKNELKSYAKETLLPKVQDLFGKLETINNKSFKEDKTKFLERFSDFTQTNFIKNGTLQETELKAFLLLNSYEDLVKKFENYSNLAAEKGKLEAGAEKPVPATPEKPDQQPSAPATQPEAAPPTTPAGTEAKKPESKPEEPFSFGKGIMDFLKWLFSLFGMKFGADAMSEMFNKYSGEKTQQLKEFYNFCKNKKYFTDNGLKNIDLLVKDPDKMNPVLDKMKSDRKDNETTEQWLQRHLTLNHQDEINSSTTITADKIAGYLQKENSPMDIGARPREETGPEPQKPAAPDSPVERVRIIISRLETAPFSDDLKTIFDDYIAKKGRPEIKDGLAKLKAKGGPVSIDAYLEGLSHNFLMAHRDVQQKLDKKEISELDLGEGIFNEIFGFALSDAKTPDERQKVDQTLERFKVTLDQIMAERGKPAGMAQPPQLTS